MSIKLSILDQSPFEGEGGADLALRDTVKLAQNAEELGYFRFWVSEHHNSDSVAGSAPEVLVSYLFSKDQYNSNWFRRSDAAALQPL